MSYVFAVTLAASLTSLFLNILVLREVQQIRRLLEKQ